MVIGVFIIFARYVVFWGRRLTDRRKSSNLLPKYTIPTPAPFPIFFLALVDHTASPMVKTACITMTLMNVYLYK